MQLRNYGGPRMWQRPIFEEVTCENNGQLKKKVNKLFIINDQKG